MRVNSYVRSGKARLQPVRVGLLNDEVAEISEGLAAGDAVVLAPETDLQDGTRVKPIVRQTTSPGTGN
jgi:hypothetical protein